jgi:hypothetical protein
LGNGETSTRHTLKRGMRVTTHNSSAKRLVLMVDRWMG